MNNDELKNIIDRAKEGDDIAFKELYDLTYRKAMVIAKTFMKDNDKANEALQLSYIKLSKKIDTINNVETFYSWFNTIVTNTCKDELKKRHDLNFSEYENDDNDLSIDIEDTSRTPDENIKYEDDRDVVLGFINDLPTEQRIALVMQVYENKTIAEIADVSEVSENTVKSRLKYAKKTLRQKVEDYKKAGNTLFVVPLIIYLRGIFDSYEQSIHIDEQLYTSISSQITNIPTPTTTKAPIIQTITSSAGKYVIVAVVVVGGSVGGYVVYNQSSMTTIDLMTEDSITYELNGNDGNATITASFNEDAINYDDSDINEFLADVTFSYDKSMNLSNGDTVTITANYDETIADELHLKINNDTYTITISDLPTLYQDISDVSNDILNQIKADIADYVNNTYITQFNANDAFYYKAAYHSAWLAVKNDSDVNRIVVLYSIETYWTSTNTILEDGAGTNYQCFYVENVGSDYLETDHEIMYIQLSAEGNDYDDAYAHAVYDESEIDSGMEYTFNLWDITQFDE